MGVAAQATPMPMLARVASLYVMPLKVITVNGSQGMVAYFSRPRVRPPVLLHGRGLYTFNPGSRLGHLRTA
jgi:hypothetical protein